MSAFPAPSSPWPARRQGGRPRHGQRPPENPSPAFDTPRPGRNQTRLAAAWWWQAASEKPCPGLCRLRRPAEVGFALQGCPRARAPDVLQVGKLRHECTAAAAPCPGCFPNSGSAGVGAQPLPHCRLFGFFKGKKTPKPCSVHPCHRSALPPCGWDAAQVPRQWGGSSNAAAQSDAFGLRRAQKQCPTPPAGHISIALNLPVPLEVYS